MKITRGHYNRKLLTFGVMIFLAIGLISTGFAAWIMSSGAESGFENGELSVGVVTESDLEFTEIKITAGSTALLFEPAKDDLKGDIKYDGANSESLTFTLSTTVSPVEYLDEIQVSMTFPASVVAAHTAGYIKLPACALLNEGQALTIAEINEAKEVVVTPHEGLTTTAIKKEDAEGNSYVELTIVVEIKWGEVFDRENPSTYLDETAVNEETKKKLTSDEKKAILCEFKRTIYGLDESLPQEEVFAHVETLQYSLKLIATVN